MSNKNKYYIKEFKTTKEFDYALHKSKIAEEIAKKAKLFKTPHIISFNKEKKQIVFEYLEENSFIELLYLQKLENNVSELFFRIGRALYEYHSKSNIPHGDLHPSNILYNDNYIYFIDFAMQKDLNFNYDKESLYRDIAAFYIYTNIKYPICKFWLIMRKKNSKLFMQFLNGYFFNQSKKFNYEEFRKCYFLEKIIIFKRLKLNWKGIFVMKERKMKDLNYDYSLSHQNEGFGTYYNQYVYGKNTFDSEIFRIEEDILNIVLDKYAIKKETYLDFSCGTGRILSLLENQFKESAGIDISAEMLKEAQQLVKESRLYHVDIIADKEFDIGKFDVITSFRFFLNAQPLLRENIIKSISERFMDKEGIFIFNNHGNRFSMRFLTVIMMKLLKGQKTFTMSKKDVERLVNKAGLEIVEYYGFGYIYKTFYKLMPKILWWYIEKIISKIGILRFFATNHIYVCKKKNGQ